MSGPPTPPPSSALEIEDAARATVAPVQPTAAPPDTPQAPTEQPAAIVPSVSVPPTNRYIQAFTAIIDLASHARYEELSQAAELADLNVRLSPMLAIISLDVCVFRLTATTARKDCLSLRH